ncbi:MAG: cytochrome c maturation protein CcmE [Coriobacteriia bacterium]|nr:cytochrome c maturation protein CcmE [Coriobacteriia bacterium]
MNKRARIRLIGVTAAILIAVAAMVYYTGGKQGAYEADIAAITTDKSLVGEQVKVGGTVVAGSWDKKSNPMRFTIRGEQDSANTGPTLKVVYTGTVPATFGDGVVAIVTGKIDDQGVLTAGDMITKCPSKYESATGATPIADVVAGGATLEGKPMRVTGYLKPASLAPAGSTGDRFIIAQNADGSGQAVPVTFAGVLPDGIKDGVQLVLGGELSDGKFVATSVALEQSQQ